MKCSIVIPTYNKSWALQRVLESIREQNPGFIYEVIVVDDGSSDDTREVCDFYDAGYHWLDRPYPCGPAKSVNIGYRAAVGDLIISQNDDVVHTGDDNIRLLCDIPPREYHVAVHRDLEPGGKPREFQLLVSERSPLFYLTSIPRRDVFGVGGRDEDFEKLAMEDMWFKDCLVRGRGLKPVMREDIPCDNLGHPRPHKLYEDAYAAGRPLYAKKIQEAIRSGDWFSSGGPWEYKETK